jgi:23S rRNA pseudouridine1911/1915/1917 synthase
VAGHLPPQWQVQADEEEIRLDKFLASSDRLGSRKRVATALERGKVFVNDVEVGLADASRRLHGGDLIRVWMDRPGSAHRRSGPFEFGQLQILFEDDLLLVVNKPAGLLSVPLPHGDRTPSVYTLLEDHLRGHRHRRPFIVHRIDRDTSGLVLFAKTLRAQEGLKDQFRRREPERVYLALVYGHPAPPTGTWRDVLVWDKTALIQRETHPTDPRGKEAIAEYRVMESLADTCLLEVRLHTGKRNQIRIQARLRGHTLVGEQRYIYGPAEIRPIDFPRQALHAHRLTFRHPVDRRELRFEAALPQDFADLLRQLRSAAGSTGPKRSV